MWVMLYEVWLLNNEKVRAAPDSDHWSSKKIYVSYLQFNFTFKKKEERRKKLKQKMF
jgi:hypothetical protein